MTTAIHGGISDERFILVGQIMLRSHAVFVANAMPHHRKKNQQKRRFVSRRTCMRLSR